MDRDEMRTRTAADPETVATAEFRSLWRDDAPPDAATYCARDVVVHDPRRPTPGEGRDAYRSFVDAQRVRFPAPDLAIERRRVADDRAVLVVAGSYAPNHDESADRRAVRGLHVSRVADGDVVERWGAFLPDAAVSALDADTAGRVVGPADGGYDEVRSVWNGTVDRSPALVVQVVDVADVRTALAFAREQDLLVAVRGGGHNVAGTAVWDAGLVVDCSAMTATRVDADDRTVWVQSGATWAAVDHAAQSFGLAVPGGVVSDTGVAGLTLGGGVGHLRSRHGLSCDALRAVDLVTPDGCALRATADEHPELFWGLRGGGGNFGVVTGFEFDCYPVGPEVATVFVVYGEADRERCLRGYRAFSESAPEAVSTLSFAGVVPDEEPFPEFRWGEPMVAFFGCHAGDVEAGTEALAPLRALADPVADLSGQMAYAEFQQALDADYPDGMRYYWTSRYLHSLPDEAVDLVGDWADRAPSPLSTVDVWPLRGAVGRVGRDETAFSGRDAAYLLGVEANWTDEADDAVNVEWAGACAEAFAPFTDGSVYPNFPGGREAGDDVVRATFADRRERLVALKDEYDPANRLRSNLNVVPSGD